ncbi:hypothetical protein DSCOOX_22140 [Desulfosarcina ovata subsp. ovata]|uniref:Phosphonate ABC transporter substrate-binding protein n=1 Tax=Desulfosarcina ovata subsp. ovata TaxID=2752305 RepID=A0A5K8AAA2_9BACT|nr:hypothetical protein DSCOOX_22140 [Desulfosarcina ovata subsp. ovata]
MTKYLSEKLNIPVSIHIQKSYQDHIDYVGQNKADIAFLGPMSYICLKDKYGTKPLIAKLEIDNTSCFYGVIITRSDSNINSLNDLKGKSFAFGDRNSTMSYIVPKNMLLKAGITIDSFNKYDFLNSHHNVALAVLGGYYDAGGVKEEVFNEFKEKGIKILAKSPPISEHLFVARSDFPKTLIENIRQHFIGIKNSQNGAFILKSIKLCATDLVPVSDRDYDPLRELLKTDIKK